VENNFCPPFAISLHKGDLVESISNLSNKTQISCNSTHPNLSFEAVFPMDSTQSPCGDVNTNMIEFNYRKARKTEPSRRIPGKLAANL